MLRRRRKRAAGDAETGIAAAGLSFSLLRHPTAGVVGYRLVLTDAAGAIVSSYDMDRADMHDMRAAISNVLRVKDGAAR